MVWKLFLDDERNPVRDDWVVCRSLSEVATVCRLQGLPNYASFDHDLGPGVEVDCFENTGMGVVRWMIESCMNDEFAWPQDFSWYVHSQNPVGVKNINRLLESWQKSAAWFQQNT